MDRKPGTYLAEEEGRKPAFQDGERVEGGGQQEASIPPQSPRNALTSEALSSSKVKVRSFKQ